MKKRPEMMDNIKFIGERFNRLVCLEELPRKLISSRMHRMGKFQCDCGKTVEARLRYVLVNRVKSCGCLALEVRKKGTKKKSRGLMTAKRKCRECGAATANYFHCKNCLTHGSASLVAYAAEFESNLLGG